MIWIFKLLIFGPQPKPCQHKWAELSREDIVRRTDGGKIGEIAFCKCEHCGEPRSWRMPG